MKTIYNCIVQRGSWTSGQSYTWRKWKFPSLGCGLRNRRWFMEEWGWVWHCLLLWSIWFIMHLVGRSTFGSPREGGLYPTQSTLLYRRRPIGSRGCRLRWTNLASSVRWTRLTAEDCPDLTDVCWTQWTQYWLLVKLGRRHPEDGKTWRACLSARKNCPRFEKFPKWH